MSSFLFTHHFWRQCSCLWVEVQIPYFFHIFLPLSRFLGASGWPRVDLCCDGSVTSLICYHPLGQPSRFPLAPLGGLGSSPVFSEDRPKLSWAACLTPYSLKRIWFQVTWLSFVYHVNAVFVWECHSFPWQYQKERFLLFRGCRFGRILRNLNQVSLGSFQRRLESPRGFEALRRGSASETSS